jgi:signal transduction histidine kinase/ActR/RegA family two-component response regulator
MTASTAPTTAAKATLSPALKDWLIRLWMLLSFVLVLSAGWAVDALSPIASSAPDVHWGEVRFNWMSPTLPAPQPVEQVVTLPDAWSARDLPSSGMGRYRISFDLLPVGPLAKEAPWVLRIDHMCSQHRVVLNDEVLANTFPDEHMRGGMMPTLFSIPSKLLKPGQNELLLEVSCHIQGGLTPLALAPLRDILPGFEHRHLWTVSLPLAMNVVGLSFGLFLLMLWWRDGNTTVGLLGIVTVVGCVRNGTYFMPALVRFPSMMTWLHFSAHTMMCGVFGLFALSFTRAHLPWFRRAMMALLVGFPLVGLAALPIDPQLTVVRGVGQALLLFTLLPSFWLLFRASRQWRMTSIMAFALGALIVTVAAARDFLVIRVMGDPTATYWMAVCFPLSLPGLYLVMTERYTRTLVDVERANAMLERKVQERTAELEAANAAKTHFLAAASHDLRQPMVAIGLISGLLRERMQSPELVSLTGRLTDAVDAMENLLSRLLDLSRLEAGAIDMHPQRVSLQALFDAIAAHECDTARAKGLEITLRANHAAVWCDPMLLEQVLRNLVGNAVRYTREGRVLVSARRRGRHWLVQVWDTGIGIADTDQRRIFEDFVQLHNPARNSHGGLGLGLGLVQRAARLLGSEVKVRSTPGRGSCFSILLPVAGQPRQNLLTDPRTPLPDTDTPLEGHHVLLLEDDEGVRLALERRLLDWGARVTSLCSMADLRECLQRDSHDEVNRPDVLLTDLSLGDGHGLQAKAEALAVWPTVRTVIITGDTAPTQLQLLADCGSPVLHKPFKPKDLLRALLTIR